ncbi:MAG: DUF1127 domain-containing protein [Paracoccaceae bacterium]
MANVAVNSQAPRGAVAEFRIVNVISSVIASIVKWNADRLTRKELSKLTDAQLEDIGLTRKDIASI